MKKFKQIALGMLMLCALIIALALCLCASVAEADQQGYASTILSLPVVPQSMTNNQVIINTNNYIPLRSTGLAIGPIFTAQNTNVGNFTLGIYPTLDGTNPFTSAWAQYNLAANGTNLVVGGTNWSQLALRGFAGVFVGVTNSTGGTVLLNTNVLAAWVGNTNAAATTNLNGGITFNRPNQ